MKLLEKKYTVLLCLLLILTCLSSCKKSFLEVVPEGRLIAQKTSEYSALLNSSVIILSANGYEAPIVMGDDVSAIEPYFAGTTLKSQRMFRWDATIYQPDENPSELTVYSEAARTTTGLLRSIYTYNSVINETPQSIGGTEAEKASIIAEARAMRALMNFLIIQIYAKPYNRATAATDPGFPIITLADATQTTFSRATVQEFYDFILADLNAAIPNLPTTIPFNGRMSRAAAQGLLGKVRVFMRDFDLALPLLNSCISDIGTVGTSVSLYDYNTTFGGTPPSWTVGIFGVSYPILPNNRELLISRVGVNPYASYLGPLFGSGPGAELIISKKAMDLYQSTDYRLRFFSDSFYGGTPYPNGFKRRNSPQHTFWLNLPDMYLLRAECKARANDLAGARQDVVFLRSRRMPDGAIPASVNGADQNQLIRFIVDERIREFAGMGHRWLDMRRLSIDPIFENDAYTHILYPATGLTTGATTFTLTKTRLTLRIPPKILGQNPEMSDNP
ncbi:RagB/SusD family nutrient uptake outer membrane protein [Pedobacter sp. MC2016-14]|uniref:RagB/SusD family nutrient uptake outer membrane protein n=1 Tax=Pedobacter sp. MC2016-14 TaxID=2897327 RepID=UPI001E3935EF|nr:RagB/SusD family nutrient uptake outer membrane protein [Pedobacter sp. MC2016-14]MCD0487788.1 RagB/SusD family nutrient uptake outer membrane protein [Pedobacter sp. MC2016-14]